MWDWAATVANSMWLRRDNNATNNAGVLTASGAARREHTNPSPILERMYLAIEPGPFCGMPAFTNTAPVGRSS